LIVATSKPVISTTPSTIAWSTASEVLPGVDPGHQLVESDECLPVGALG
jgi:hypothetical protein